MVALLIESSEVIEFVTTRSFHLHKNRVALCRVWLSTKVTVLIIRLNHYKDNA